MNPDHSPQAAHQRLIEHFRYATAAGLLAGPLQTVLAWWLL